MRIGICGSPDAAADLLAAGWDYVEFGASSTVGDPAFDLSRVRGAEVTNLFFPAGHDVHERPDDALAYARVAMERAAEVGVAVMVVGSGGVRRAAQAGPEAEARFVDVVARAQAAVPAVRLAPESLHAGETNVGNRLGPMAAALAARGVGFTADLFHLLREDEPYEGLPLPTHVHFASRSRDLPAADDPDVLAFFAWLRRIGYDGRVTYEGSRCEPREGAARVRAFANG